MGREQGETRFIKKAYIYERIFIFTTMPTNRHHVFFMTMIFRWKKDLSSISRISTLFYGGIFFILFGLISYCCLCHHFKVNIKVWMYMLAFFTRSPLPYYLNSFQHSHTNIVYLKKDRLSFFLCFIFTSEIAFVHFHGN